jgi:diguanylate cyclase (GGDEF)-like protein
LLPWLGVRRPRPLPAHRTLALSLTLLLVALLLAPAALAPGPARAHAAIALVWWQLAGVFGLAAVFVFHVEINSEAHTFSLSEVPLVLGLFFAQPRDLVLARMVGEAFVLLVVERQTATKLAFNASVFLAESMTALAIYRLVAGTADPLAARTWAAALLASGAASCLGALAVWAVIRVHGGELNPRLLLLAAASTATGNTSLAAIAGVLLCTDPWALVPLLAVAAVLMAGYRGYTRLTRRYDGLELLYQFTRITSGPQRPDETMQRVLQEAGSLLRTGRAMIALFSPGQDEPWLFLGSGTGSGPGGGPASDPGLGPAAGPAAGRTPAPAAGPAPGPAAGPDGVHPQDGQVAAAGQATQRLDRARLPVLIRDQVLRQGRLMLIPRTSSVPAHREVLAALAAQDCIAAPLVSGGETTGVLIVCDRLGDVSTFDADDARLFATLASQAAIALENGRLIERLHEQARVREYEATHDALTGLPNRSLFGERLEQAVSVPGRLPGAVLLMDLDGFKEVNDTLGHHMGDQLLREVAQRLAATVAGRGTVARLGGDEFVVLLPDLPDTATGLAIAAELTAEVRRPIQLTSMTVEVGVSIGMAVWPDHGSESSTLLQRADVAMYAAKRTRSGVNLYDPDTDWNSQVRLRLAAELRAALTGHQIDVRYQPIARAADGHVVGAEALVRWTHPELGYLSPSEFVPVAERTGLIHELTLYVMDLALAQVRAWQSAGLDLFVTVNLPPQVLRDVDWSAKVADRLAAHQVDPHWLTFEITESGIMTDPERMIGILGDLASTGISFAIDDFGTGYSSLAYLQQLPVSKVKIDKSFVTPMTSEPAAAAIVRSVVDLARSLHLTVVAEGVEDQRTLDQLIAVDCHLVQGYYLSRAIPADELTAWIRQRQVPRPRAAGLSQS